MSSDTWFVAHQAGTSLRQPADESFALRIQNDILVTGYQLLAGPYLFVLKRWDQSKIFLAQLFKTSKKNILNKISNKQQE